MRQFSLNQEFDISIRELLSLCFEDRAFLLNFLKSLSMNCKDISISEWKQTKGKAKQRSISFEVDSESLSYLKFIARGQPSIRTMVNQTLELTSTDVIVSSKMYFDIINSPLIAERMAFSSVEQIDGRDYGGEGSRTECVVVTKVEHRGEVIQDMVEPLMENEAKLMARTWLHYLEQTLRVDKEQQNHSPEKQRTTLSRINSLHLSSSGNNLQQSPPPRLEDSIRSSPPAFVASPPPMHPPRSPMSYDIVSRTSPDILESSPSSLHRSSTLRRSPPGSPTTPEMGDLSKEIITISHELDSVRTLMEQNFRRIGSSERSLRTFQQQLERQHAAAKLQQNDPNRLSARLPDTIVANLTAQVDTLDETFTQAIEDTKKAMVKEDLTLEVRFDELIRKLNSVQRRRTMLFKSWRQFFNFVVFLALWPVVLRHFWTYGGRKILKIVFRGLDYVLNIQYGRQLKSIQKIGSRILEHRRVVAGH